LNDSIPLKFAARSDCSGLLEVIHLTAAEHQNIGRRLTKKAIDNVAQQAVDMRVLRLISDIDVDEPSQD
jgi:hypothetical protein